MGDLNSRIGELGNKGQRKSYDKSVNKEGQILLNFAHKHNLSFLNGATTSNSSGFVTFANKNGSSVIDYCLVSESLVSLVKDFSVLSRVHLHDFPILLELRTNDDNSLSECVEHKSLIETVVFNEKNADRVPFFCSMIDEGLNCLTMNYNELHLLIKNSARTAMFSCPIYKQFSLNIRHLNSYVALNNLNKTQINEIYRFWITAVKSREEYLADSAV